MKKILSTLALLLALGGEAAAGSSPGLINGQVPTAAQWNSYFAAKEDELGYTPLNVAGGVMTGRLVTAPAPVSGVNTAGFNLTPGSAPTSPTNGDLWITSSGIFAQINGITIPLVGSPFSGNLIITSNSANALAVGPNGATNPSFNVDASTASAVTGLNVKSATSGAGVALTTISSATNDAMTINAKGSGTLGFGNSSTGNITIGNSSIATITVASVNMVLTNGGANSLAVGPNGATNPTFNVDDSTASAATGVNVKSAAAGSGVAISTLSSGSNENISFDAKGTGIIKIGSVSTGGVQLASAGGGVAVNGATIGANALAVAGTTAMTSNSATALAIGANGATNPALNIDASTASSVTGLGVKSQASGSGVGLTTLSSASSDAMNINAKGSGVVTIGAASTGQVQLGAGGGGIALNGTVTGNSVTVSGGAIVTSTTISSGSFTVNCQTSAEQFITGPTSAWTITAPANDGSCFVLLTQPGASGQIPTFSGFTVGSNTGASITTAAAAKFTLSFWRVNGISGYSIFAHQ